MIPWLGLAALVLCVPTGVAGQARSLGVDAVFDLEYADDPHISPDGRRVAYVRHSTNRETDRRESYIYLVEPETRAQRSLTPESRSSRSPRFSRDGSELAWVSAGDGLWQIRVRTLATGQTRTVVTTTAPPFSLAWAPSGGEIAFMQRVDHPEARIAGLPEPPAGALWADPARVIERVVSQTDGVEFAPDGAMHLFVVPTTAGSPRQIMSSGFELGAWTPGSPLAYTRDGTRIILSANMNIEPWREPTDTELVEVLVASGDVRRITGRYGPDDEPAISPDGRWVAYTGYDDLHQWYEARDLYITSPTGSGETRNLSAMFDGDVSRPAWSADSTAVFAVIEDGGVSRLARFDLLGGFQVVADDLGTGGRASGGSASISVSRQPERQRFAFTITGDDVPGEIAVGSIGGQTDVLTGDGTEMDGIGRVEEVRYQAADGQEIQGWAVLPPGFDETRRYPLIIEVHGGRGTHYGPRFDLEKQIMASAGYVVLYANYRGSSGYGSEFGNLLNRDTPDVASTDLLAGADALIERGWVDAERLYIVGGSMGGHIAGWTTAMTDRLRAAVLWYPVVNWSTFWLTTSMSPEMRRYHHDAYPWEDPEDYASKSLLSVVDRVTTPTLIVVGDEDYVTPVSEALAYFRALKIVGTDARLVRVPGEPHGIRARPSHQMAKLQATIAWLDYFDDQVANRENER